MHSHHKSQEPEVVKLHDHIIVFDGVCILCSYWTKFVIKRDKIGKFKFVAVQSSCGKEILEWLGMPTNDVKTMVYIHHGKSIFESMAFLDIVKQLNWPWSWLNVLRYFPAFVRNGFYRVIANNRYSIFGKKDCCMIPEHGVRERFLN